MQDVADQLEEIIGNYGATLEGCEGLSEDTYIEFERGLRSLEGAIVYVQRIDWLLSGDDSEETFHERLREDLKEI